MYLIAKQLVLQTTKQVIYGRRKEESMLSGETNHLEEMIDSYSKNQNNESNQDEEATSML